jgi:hypothetical protein
MRITLMQLGQRRCPVPIDTIFQHHRRSGRPLLKLFAHSPGMPESAAHLKNGGFSRALGDTCEHEGPIIDV